MELLPLAIFQVVLVASVLSHSFLQKCTTMEIMYANISSSTNYSGSNIIQIKGVGPTLFSLTLFQSLVTAAGYDPTRGPGSSCSASGQCVVPWGKGTKAVSSVVLIANGASFAVCFHSICILFQIFMVVCKILTAIFTTIASAADYGTFGRWLLFVITCICWAAQFASMSLTSMSLIVLPHII